jgi:hypothetical protein
MFPVLPERVIELIAPLAPHTVCVAGVNVPPALGWSTDTAALVPKPLLLVHPLASVIDDKV